MRKATTVTETASPGARKKPTHLGSSATTRSSICIVSAPTTSSWSRSRRLPGSCRRGNTCCCSRSCRRGTFARSLTLFGTTLTSVFVAFAAVTIPTFREPKFISMRWQICVCDISTTAAATTSFLTFSENGGFDFI